MRSKRSVWKLSKRLRSKFMKILYSFRETKNFTKQIVNLVSDDDFAKFQRLLIQIPEAGKLIPGGGGIRKIRFPAKGKGKRGGARLIYYFAVLKEKIFLLENTRYNTDEQSKDPKIRLELAKSYAYLGDAFVDEAIAKLKAKSDTSEVEIKRLKEALA